MADEKPKRTRKKTADEPEAVVEETPVAAEPDAAVEPEAAPEAEAPEPGAGAPEPAAAPAEPARRTAPKAAAAKSRSAGTRAAAKPKAAAKPRRERSKERKPIVRLPKPEAERGRRQERRGVVVSSAMDKTIVVKVDTVRSHPRYKKVIRRSTKFHAHDEQNSAKVGDVVRIVETRPISTTKRWRLAEIVQVAR